MRKKKRKLKVFENYPSMIPCETCQQDLPKEHYYWRKSGFIANKSCRSCYNLVEETRRHKWLGPYIYKKCRICKFEKMCKEFPSNPKNFIGWDHICKECKSKGYYRQCQLNEDQLICCMGCQKNKLKKEFPKSKRNFNGLQSYCHKCKYWKLPVSYTHLTLPTICSV